MVNHVNAKRSADYFCSCSLLLAEPFVLLFPKFRSETMGKSRGQQNFEKIKVVFLSTSLLSCLLVSSKNTFDITAYEEACVSYSLELILSVMYSSK